MPLARRALLATLPALCAPALVKAQTKTPANSAKLRYLAHSDQGGRPDGVQVMVSRKHLYIGHMFSGGFTVIDVTNPSQPQPVKFVAAPPNTRMHHLQAFNDLLLVVAGADIPMIGKYSTDLSYYQQSFAGSMKGNLDFAAGLKIYDISKPAEPREIAFLNMPGIGLNRLWYVGGRYAYVSAHLDGFTDHILVVVDMQDPTRPAIVGRWWLPGMWREGGETPTWKNSRVALHHMIVAGTLGYGAWRDGGFTILDIADPTNIKLISHVNTSPPFAGGTHTPLPLPGRNLAVLLDESTSLGCAKGLSYGWIYDVRSPQNPVSIATLPTPKDQAWCRPGENFGPHNMHENRPDSFQSEETLFVTYHNAGLRIFDASNAFEPREIGRFIAPPPTRILDPRPGYALAPLTCDVNVQRDGMIYLTDWNAGLNVLAYDG